MHLLFCSKSELITTAHSLKASVSSGRDLFLEKKYSGCDWGLFTGVLHYLIRSYVVLSITYEQLSYIQVSSHQEASDKWLSTSRQLNRSQSGELFNFFCWCTSKSELLVLSFCNFQTATHLLPLGKIHFLLCAWSQEIFLTSQITPLTSHDYEKLPKSYNLLISLLLILMLLICKVTTLPCNVCTDNSTQWLWLHLDIQPNSGLLTNQISFEKRCDWSIQRKQYQNWAAHLYTVHQSSVLELTRYA